jgi:hypothetical protein
VKEPIFLLLSLVLFFQLKAQPANCIFKKPVITIHFGTGNVRDVNTAVLPYYERVPGYCPRDGHYVFTPFTSDCFSGDWLTLAEDHTPGDKSGNMLIVNSSYNTGTFLKTVISGLKGGTTYEFGVWLMNVCRISDKCPYPLLPNISITLQTASGKSIALAGTGEIERLHEPRWKQHKAIFTTPAFETSFTLVMVNNKPGGCGNDFAVDDITFRECIRQPPPVTTAAKKTIVAKKSPVAQKPVPKNATPSDAKKEPRNIGIVKPQKDSLVYSTPVVKSRPPAFPPPPPLLRTRENTVVKQIETEAREISIKLYDNGEIDGDTVSIYHNNVLLMGHARLSQKPVSISVAVDAAQPYHEIVMVAENLGSIPPNTSLMVITAGTTRHEVFISSNEQRNAKVILRLKE